MQARMAVLAVGVLSAVLASSSHLVVAQSSQSRPENQPEMQSALSHLRKAQSALEAGSHDKGGHRVKALKLVKDAINEVQAGIQHDNTHTSGTEKK